LLRLLFAMRKPVVCIGTQAVMDMKGEQLDTTLLASDSRKMEKYR
jgi:hypothetical protein